MQKVKLHQLGFSQLPWITLIRACKQHAARGKENKDFKYELKSL